MIQGTAAVEASQAELVKCYRQYSLDGVTFSSEPMQQAEDLAKLVKDTALSITNTQCRHIYRLLGDGTRDWPLFYQAWHRSEQAADGFGARSAINSILP
jgi:hypothetical protein